VDLLDLAGRVAVVTGGGTGIGAAAAKLLAAHGADVAIAARTVDDLERTAEGIEADSGRRCLIVPTDVKDERQVVAMIERSVDELGRIDILVNNAGGTRLGPLRRLPTKAWDATFDLNVRSAYVATREAGTHFLKQHSGAIVNVSSDAGVYGVQGGAHYSAAKAALQMFTEVTAAEWGPHGVRANCVAVGGIASERAKAAWEVAGIDPAAIGAGAMLRRVGRPQEVAAAILFLVSDAASYITAQTISVDGGHPMGGIRET
jgi:NAD(P)-dependent dehydrogenase (short-subunit alcohol dehydrogenase family)